MKAAAARTGVLRTAGQYRAVVTSGLRLSGTWVILYVLPSEQDIRIGFVCGRAIGGAVARNRCRRRLKEAWRGMGARARGGFDIVVVARPESAGVGLATLVADLGRLLVRAEVLPR